MLGAGGLVVNVMLVFRSWPPCFMSLLCSDPDLVMAPACSDPCPSAPVIEAAVLRTRHCSTSPLKQQEVLVYTPRSEHADVPPVSTPNPTPSTQHRTWTLQNRPTE